MKIIKFALLITLIVIIAATYLITQGHTSINSSNNILANLGENKTLVNLSKNLPKSLNIFTKKISSESSTSADFISDTKQQTETLSQRAKEVGGHVSNVLGTAVEADQEQPPIHERAMEYGRYLYCQQVIKDYENRYPEN